MLVVVLLLELEQNFPKRNMTTVTYNDPVFEMTDGKKWEDENRKPMSFAVAGDPVSMLDGNAQTSIKAADFNVDTVKILSVPTLILRLNMP